MPHAAGCALQLRFDPVASNPDRAWAWIYLLFRYMPTLHAPHFKEAVLPHRRGALRR